MTAEPSILNASNWRTGLPTLTARLVTLREPVAQDLGPLVALLTVADATRFGMEDQTEMAVQGLVERAVARPRRRPLVHLRHHHGDRRAPRSASSR